MQYPAFLTATDELGKYSTASTTQDFSFDASQSKNKSASYTNSHIGGKNITIKSTKDTTVEGGVVKATENVNLDVGGDLKVASLQDSSKSKSMSIGGGSSGVNAGISRGNSKWVNEKSSISGGGNVNIYVANKTTLKGADIYSKTDKLSLDTGDLEYSDIRDKSKTTGVNASLNAGTNTGQNYNVKADLQNKTQVNKSTIGQGTITVRSNPDKDLSDLNRDMANAQIKVKDTDVTIEADTASVNALLNPIKTAKDIKHEGQRIGDRVETVVEGVKKALDENDNDSALDYVGQSFARQNATMDFVKKHPDIAEILTDPNASPEVQQAARNLQAQYIAKELNIPYAQVKLYNSSDKDKVAGNSAGMDPKDKNDHNVLINKAENSNNQSDSYILNHEISHEKDKADGVRRGEDFADLMGAKGDDALAKELSYAGFGEEAKTTDEWRENNFNSTLLYKNTKLAESYGYDEVDQSDINIILQRTDENNERTLGEVTISNTANSKIVNFYTLELPDRNNQEDVSRVNADKYKAERVKISKYPTEVLLLENKHNRKNILVHNGNYVRQIKGCILLGKEQYKNAVGYSVQAMKEQNKYIDDVQEIDKKNGEPTNIYYYIKDINYVKK